MIPVEEIYESEIIFLYKALARLHSDIDPRLVPLMTRLERYLFSKLSIEEIERLRSPEDISI